MTSDLILAALLGIIVGCGATLAAMIVLSSSLEQQRLDRLPDGTER